MKTKAKKAKRKQPAKLEWGYQIFRPMHHVTDIIRDIMVTLEQSQATQFQVINEGFGGSIVLIYQYKSNSPRAKRISPTL